MAYRAKHDGRNRAVLDREDVEREAARKAQGVHVALRWRPFYSSGQPLIDAEHEESVRLINLMIGAMAEEEAEERLLPLIQELIEHIQTHFSNEEQLLLEAGFPDAAAHAEIHRNLLERAYELTRLFELRQDSVGDLLGFLIHNVVARHMLRDDRKFFSWLKAKQAQFKPPQSRADRQLGNHESANRGSVKSQTITSALPVGYVGLLEAVKQAADSVVITDIQGNIQFVNPAFTAMTGYSSDEALDQNPRILKSGLHPATFYRTLWNTVRSGQMWSGEVVNRRKDGSHYAEEMRIAPIRDKNSEITGYIAIKHDVTEKREHEKSQALLAAIVESSEDAMVVTTPAGVILTWNRGANSLFGYSPDEAVGMDLSMFLAPERLSELAYLTGQISQGNTISQYESQCLRKDGCAIHVSFSAAPIRNPAGEVVAMSAVLRDISERRRAAEAQQDSKNRYRVLFEDSGDASWLIDEQGVLDCNSAARQMFGYSADAPMFHPYVMSPPNQPDGTPSRPAAQQRIASALLNGKERFEWLHQRKSGEVFPAEVCLTALTLSGRSVLLATVRDITERKHAEEALLFKTALLEAQAESTIDGILVVDEFDRILLVNKQFGLHFEIPEELLSKRDDAALREYTSGKVEDPDAFIARISYLNSNRAEKSNDELRLKNGKIFDRYSAPLFDAKGQYRGRIWYHRDITERKAAEERIQFLAYHDALTELPHRTLLHNRLDSALTDARRRGEKIALMYLDLDEFKSINDSFGHLFGDILLKDVAKRIKHCGREQDMVARVGGDEFLILLGGAKDPADAAIAVQRIMAALNEGFVIQGQLLNVSCSVGISMFPEHGADSETLIKNADSAMYSAKAEGRNRMRFFTDEMNAEAVERLTMDKNLRLALDREEFFLVYQPQIEIESGKITGFEALIRWQQPEMGLVPPDRFISIAERNGLIVPIGEWVLRTACAQAKRWQDSGLPAVPVAVNVSAVQFRQEGFTDLIRKVLSEIGLSAQYLELELTESLLLSNADLVLATLLDLKKMGLQLAIDDFGTGYSSLSYLTRFPVDKLKIDRSFIREVAVNSNDAAIAIAIISMAKNLHLKVIAEGVENEEQQFFLRAHGCDEMQGFYFSKPLSAGEAASMQRDRVCCMRQELPPPGLSKLSKQTSMSPM
jgi:diguanylate cyclase (GGDEF)-like protein/PAS domain S-box-containing protein/hemerythrin-like metal-binding protein